MNKRSSKKGAARAVLGALAVAVVAFGLAVGCGGKDPASNNGKGDDKVPGDTTQVPGDTTQVPGDTTQVPGDTTQVPGDTTQVVPGLDARLILDDGYVWAGEVPLDEVDGIYLATHLAYDFRADGTVLEYGKFLGLYWTLADENPGTWRTSGNQLYITYEDEDYGTDTIQFSLSGGALTLISDEMTIVLTKELLSNLIVDDDRERDPALVNTMWETEDNEMWIFTFDESSQFGMALHVSGMGQVYYDWFTSGGNLILTPIEEEDGDEVTYAYEVSGDELTVNGITYIKNEDSGMFKSRAGKLSKAPKLSKAFKLSK
jgi:hypothetical protein